MSNIEDALKQIEKEQAKLVEQKKALEVQLKEKEKEDKKLEDLFQKSGFATPRALIAALMEKYNVRSVGSVTPATGKTRRKRTKVTAELRDQVHAKVAGGLSKNKASQEFGISYLVVNKIMDGKYDNL